MKPYAPALLLLASLCTCTFATAQIPAPAASRPQSSTRFDDAAPAALQTMRAQAETLKVGGVALLAFFEGDAIQSWTSRMLVVGSMKHEPTASAKGDNLLAVAYAKAAEMADTLKDSGTLKRPLMTGEFGWQGGAIVRVPGGYLIAAFSGGKGEEDYAISRTGLAELQRQMKLPPR